MGISDHPLAASQPPSSCFNGFMASPSWFPLLQRDRHYSRFHLLGHDGGRIGRWRNLFRRLKKELEGKAVYGGSKHLTFHYDVVSYSKNFDDGCSSSPSQAERSPPLPPAAV